MKLDLPIHSYALATQAELPVPETRHVALGAQGFRARKARLPSLAIALGEALLAEVTLTEEVSVLLGTALGCLTETAAFVENMIAEQGAAPKPRAFTASVHNAMASELARKLGARGECQTFVAGENSHLQTLFAAQAARARGSRADQLVGSLDEWTDYVQRARASCGEESQLAEGGALFHLGSSAGERPPLARILSMGLARPANTASWLASELDPHQVDAVLVQDGDMTLPGRPSFEFRSLLGAQPASGAVALALSVAVLVGEAPAECLGLQLRPRRLAIATRTRFGELGLLVVESAR